MEASAAELLPISEQVKTLIEQVTESICADDGFFSRVESVEDKARDGFIPYTDGGWNGVVYFDFYSDITWQLERFRPILDQDYEECREEFKRENPDADPDNLHDHPAWDNWQSDWEHGDACTWFVYARVLYYEAGSYRNESGRDEFLFCLGINDDFNYGRDSVGGWAPGVGTKWIWEQNVPVSQFLGKADEIRKAMLQAWKDAS